LFDGSSRHGNARTRLNSAFFFALSGYTTAMFDSIRHRIVTRLAALLDHLLLEDSPEDADRYLRLAKLKFRQKDYRGAIANLNVTLKHEPRNWDALYWRCRAKYEDGQTVSALHDALRATEVRSDDPLSYYMLGNIHLILDNFSEAEEAYSVVLEIGGCEGQAYAGRGYARHNLQRYAESLDDLNAAKAAGFDRALVDEYIDNAKRRLEMGG
jgi:tetratricopeptide (TPR) repeat protein